MEEDINDLKKYISFSEKSENFSHNTDWDWHKELATKIENLIKGYKELEKYKKIAEKLAEQLEYMPVPGDDGKIFTISTTKDAIEWARKEVEDEQATKKKFD